MSAPFTREDMVDAIATAISDSMDVDWTSRTGAEAVVSNCGVFELYEALDDMIELARPNVYPQPDKPDSPYGRLERARAALAKARGDQ